MFPASILQGTYNQSNVNGGGASGPFSSASITNTTTFGFDNDEIYRGMAVKGNEIYLFNSYSTPNHLYPRYSSNGGSNWTTSTQWDTMQVANQECFYDTNINKWVALQSDASSSFSTLHTNSDPQNNSWTPISASNITGNSRTVKFINSNYYGISTSNGLLRGTSLTSQWSQRATTSSPSPSIYLQIGESNGTYIASLKDHQTVFRSTDGIVFSGNYSANLTGKLISPVGDGSGNWIAGNLNVGSDYYKSTDDGQTWSVVSLSFTNIVQFTQIQFIVYSDGIWIAGTNYGKIISSTNPFTSGTWNVVDSNSGAIHALQSISSNKIGYTGSNGTYSFFKIITLS